MYGTEHLKNILLILERGEGREKERQININMCLSPAHPLLGTWPATQACALPGNQTSDPLVCRLALNPLSHTSQVSFMFVWCFFIFKLSYTKIIRSITEVILWCFHGITSRAIYHVPLFHSLLLTLSYLLTYFKVTFCL